MDIFEKSFKFSMKWEGGSLYTNDPRDPGGPTKYGICLKYNKNVIPDKDGNGKIDATDVKLLTEDDALKIYREIYFKPNKCDQLPDAIGFMLADMVFNPGPGKSPKLLQTALNKNGVRLKTDGCVGPLTIAAAKKSDAKKVVTTLTDLRIRYYKGCSNWATYGKGWTNRSNDCLAEALKIAG